MNIGKLHVLVVHFPIALALAAVLAEALWLATRKDALKQAGLYCLVLATVSSLPAIVAGMALERSMTFVGDDLSILASHKTWAIGSFVAALVATGARLALPRSAKWWWLAGYFAILVALVVCISLTGHYGGMLVHGENFLSGIF